MFSLNTAKANNIEHNLKVQSFMIKFTEWSRVHPHNWLLQDTYSPKPKFILHKVRWVDRFSEHHFSLDLPRKLRTYHDGWAFSSDK